jgi:hypothetical protein
MAARILPASAVSARLLRPCSADGGSWMTSLQADGGHTASGSSTAAAAAEVGFNSLL